MLFWSLVDNESWVAPAGIISADLELWVFIMLLINDTFELVQAVQISDEIKAITGLVTASM